MKGFFNVDAFRLNAKVICIVISSRTQIPYSSTNNGTQKHFKRKTKKTFQKPKQYHDHQIVGTKSQRGKTIERKILRKCLMAGQTD